ncbi:hypothetical protein F9C07_2106189 [Aspergillus flavus]|uniref:Uncharacterized protein n=1 Tax=Aspergillus flavus (strain ATCC 200026 / FGSC A1120 / IAM 13836 / NRRL 3357 / JCM 12722 / SRRC 167) TaxID=332952 RepID=A0A7G5K503_ASPFN|nr:uncharacterized protein G4B84_006275 [Aspergillus flavus NRRL3357]QMW42945.1 hypothetical protein G4B11_006315 [Aspergillus flavus]KAF7625295.1 hypothetical protein AFLA_002166 [Aspergillus flavus NRRL3357]QMW30894.1 hypothetical protein G4B84_006275 [Aspergillus flavus NRRL3357]QRD89800.1 hypothetical protein F9C07_2106189 [Aspergillus flavus]UDD59737.1 hypothetical protein AFCA_007163 [Aspergillus flavus]
MLPPSRRPIHTTRLLKNLNNIPLRPTRRTRHTLLHNNLIPTMSMSMSMGTHRPLLLDHNPSPPSPSHPARATRRRHLRLCFAAEASARAEAQPEEVEEEDEAEDAAEDYAGDCAGGGGACEAAVGGGDGDCGVGWAEGDGGEAFC